MSYLQLDGKTTDFDELWEVYLAYGQEVGWSKEEMEWAKQVYFAGALGGVGVLANRLAELPGRHDKTTILQGISNEVVRASKELFTKNKEMRQPKAAKPTLQ